MKIGNSLRAASNQGCQPPLEGQGYREREGAGGLAGRCARDAPVEEPRHCEAERRSHDRPDDDIGRVVLVGRHSPGRPRCPPATAVLATFCIRREASRRPSIVVMQPIENRVCDDTTVCLGCSRHGLFLPVSKAKRQRQSG